MEGEDTVIFFTLLITTSANMFRIEVGFARYGYSDPSFSGANTFYSKCVEWFYCLKLCSLKLFDHGACRPIPILRSMHNRFHMSIILARARIVQLPAPMKWAYFNRVSLAYSYEIFSHILALPHI